MSGTRLSVFIASSLDGYIATRDGSLAWLEEAARSDEDYGYESFLESANALAMGRGTYDHIAHLDPLPFGNRPVFVFTHRPARTARRGHLLAGVAQSGPGPMDRDGAWPGLRRRRASHQ